MQVDFDKYVLNKLNIVKMQIEVNGYCEVNKLFWSSTIKDNNNNIKVIDLLKACDFQIHDWLKKNNIKYIFNKKRKVYIFSFC